MFDMFCDVGGHQAYGRLVFWAWIFHLSKMYEPTRINDQHNHLSQLSLVL